MYLEGTSTLGFLPGAPCGGLRGFAGRAHQEVAHHADRARKHQQHQDGLWPDVGAEPPRRVREIELQGQREQEQRDAEQNDERRRLGGSLHRLPQQKRRRRSRARARAGDGMARLRRNPGLCGYFATGAGADVSLVTPELAISCFMALSSLSR